MTNFLNRPFVAASLVLGILLLVGFAVVGWGISARGQNNTISVTGSATQNVTADLAKWSVDVRRTAGEGSVPQAEAAVVRDAAAINRYLASQHLASSTMTVSTIFADQNYKQYASDPQTYNIHQTVTVQSTDVKAIDALSKNIDAINQLAPGSLVSPNPPEYFISSLPQLRVALLGQAVADAKARAQELAKNGGSSVGALQSASSGVVQVLAPNSTNVEGYGTYDTSTIEKQVMVTAHAEFYVK